MTGLNNVNLSASVDNALVVQKDKIIENINSGLLACAREQLDLVSQLWSVLGYGYKIGELEVRMSDKARELIRDLDVELCRFRRGSKRSIETLRRIEYLKTFRS